MRYFVTAQECCVLYDWRIIMSNKTRLIICGLGLIIAAVGIFFMINNEAEPKTITKAIDDGATEFYQKVGKELYTEYFGDTAICVYESDEGGMTAASVINKGTDDKPEYLSSAYCGIEPDEFARNSLENYFTVDVDKEYEYICCVSKDRGAKAITVNNNAVSLASFEYDDVKLQCWICRIKRGEKVNVTVER